MLNFVTVLIATFFLNSLSAICITTEFFPESKIPLEFRVQKGDLTLFKLNGWPVDSSVTVFEERLITEEVSTQIGDFRNTIESVSPSFVVFSSGHIPGEPVKFIFKDVEKNIIEAVTAVPCPLFARSSIDNATIQATLKKVSPAIYAITFTGFQKDEELFMISKSYHECLKDMISCDFTRMYLPEVIGKKGGLAKVSYKRSNGELLQLEIPWGLELLKYYVVNEEGESKVLIENKEFLKMNPSIAEYFKTKRS